MKVSEFLVATSYALRGTDEDSPTIGTDEANYWISTLNRKKNELYNNTRVLWDATFESTPPNEPGTVATTGNTTLTGTNTYFTDYRVGDTILVSGETVRTIATITSDTVLTVTSAFSNTASGLTFTRATIVDDGVANYSLHRSLIAPSSMVEILKTDSTYSYIDFINPREKNNTTRKAYIAGVNPKVLTVTTDIESTEDIVGGTLYVPGYYMPADLDLSDEDALLPIPDPFWGVMSTAAEIAFNDITYEDRVEGLNIKANELYRMMVRNNRRGTYGNPQKPPKNVYQIRSAETN